MVMVSHNEGSSIGREEIWTSFQYDSSSEEERERAIVVREMNLDLLRGEILEEIRTLNQFNDIGLHIDQLELVTVTVNSKTNLDQIRRGE